MLSKLAIAFLPRSKYLLILWLQSPSAEWQYTALTYSFPNFEPVRCSMSDFNCCFLTCIQISQEAGKVVWYTHLFKNFPQFVVIHIVKGFCIVNKAGLDVFLELSCFFYDLLSAHNMQKGGSHLLLLGIISTQSLQADELTLLDHSSLWLCRGSKWDEPLTSSRLFKQLHLFKSPFLNQ